MSYRVGSLNIHKKKHAEAFDTGRDFFSFIHDFIMDENLDILALQEVVNERELQRILKNLSGWCGQYGKPTAREKEIHGFAFLWNSRRVKPVECSHKQTPRILSEYCSDELMRRGPLYGRFTPVGVGPHYEIRLINVHLFQSESLQLRKECGLVTGDVYNQIDLGERDGHFKSVFTLVLGDYNHRQKTCSFITNLYGDPHVVTFQKKPTTLKMLEEGYTANDFDHFSFNLLKNITVPFKEDRIDAVGRYFKSDSQKGAFQKYKECVSDHVPIVIEFL